MPDLLSFVVKETQGAHVAGYSEVSIVSAEFQRNLLVLVSQRHVAVLPAPVLERTYASSKAVSCSFPVDDPFSLPRFTPVVGKTKEIEALYVRFSGRFVEVYQPCLLWMERQSILGKAFRKNF